MPASIPAALRTADIARFALRAGQLEKARPAVAYWCNYWIVEQIISKNLHQQDEDSKAYTMALMDNLEQIKVDYADNDAIVDDMAGHAYIEQFAQETFQRADNAMNAAKASRQTADTFQAAATFFEVNQVWGPLDAETASKIKFAKFHALRIAKAIKAGEDPNASNPETNKADVEVPSEPHAIQSPPTDQKLPLDHRPIVEDIADHENTYESGDPKDSSSKVEHYYQQPPTTHDVSPLGPSSRGSDSSHGHNYFPNISDESIRGTAPEGSSVSKDFKASSPWDSPKPMGASHLHRPTDLSARDGHATTGTDSGYTAASAALPAVASDTQARVTNRVDEVAIMAAQKHAKFAISALNFEDVSTAVKELREALEALTSHN